MKPYYLVLIFISLLLGCKSEGKIETDQTDKYDKIRQINNPIHILNECEPKKVIIGNYEFQEVNSTTDSVQITINSGAIKLSEYQLSLQEHSKRKGKNLILNGANTILPIYYDIPPYSDSDTLNLTIDLNRPNRKTVSNTCQIVYHHKLDTVDFISYDISTTLVKYGFTKKFESEKVKLKKNYGYFLNYETEHKITKTNDSINYFIQLSDVIIEDSETGRKTKITETPKLNFNYPLHYDIQVSDYTFKPFPRGAVEIKHKTDKIKDSYAGYSFYFERLGRKITGVLSDCDNLDTLGSENVFLPQMLKPGFFSNKEVE